jgi:hypothetical protein
VGYRAFCDKAHDDQYTKLYDGFFSGESFKREMLADGHVTDVLCMDAICASQMAWVMPGLSQAERTARLFMYQYWASALWGDALFIPGSVCSKARIQGLVPNNIFEMMANADGRAIFLSRCTDAEAKQYVEKAFSNDVVEGQHSDLVRGAGGYKPDPAVCEAIFKSIDALSAIKMLPDNEFWIPMSSKKKYDFANAAAEVLSKWNDGTALAPDSRAFRQYDLSRQASMIKASKGELQMWRDFHKVRTTVRSSQ